MSERKVTYLTCDFCGMEGTDLVTLVRIPLAGGARFDCCAECGAAKEIDKLIAAAKGAQADLDAREQAQRQVSQYGCARPQQWGHYGG